MTRFKLKPQFSLRLTLVVLTLTGLAVWKFTPQIRAAILHLTARGPDSPFDSTPSVASRGIWSSFQSMHDWYEKQFVDSPYGFGLSRVVHFDDPTRRKIEVNGQLYAMKNLELMTFENRKEPLVYITRFGFLAKSSYKQAETRPLTEFESGALKKLHAGRQFVYNGDAKQPQLVGALRASESCLACHDAKPGALLGSFTYTLAAIPKLVNNQLILPGE